MRRTLDLWVLQPDGEQTLLPGKACSGVHKLAQRWALLMLTPRGSMKFDPERGCGFTQRIYNSEAAITTAFLFSNADVLRQMRRDETADDPDDERIASVTLTGISVFMNSVSIQVSLRNLAGDTSSIILPVSSA